MQRSVADSIEIMTRCGDHGGWMIAWICPPKVVVVVVYLKCCQTLMNCIQFIHSDSRALQLLITLIHNGLMMQSSFKRKFAVGFISEMFTHKHKILK